MGGSFITGPICDWFGRKKGILLSWASYLIFQCAISLSQNFAMYTLLRIFVAISYVFAYISVFTHAVEMAPTKYRTYTALWISLSSSLAHTSLPMVAYFFREWRSLVLVTALYTVPCIVILYY